MRERPGHPSQWEGFRGLSYTLTLIKECGAGAQEYTQDTEDSEKTRASKARNAGGSGAYESKLKANPYAPRGERHGKGGVPDQVKARSLCPAAELPPRAVRTKASQDLQGSCFHGPPVLPEA